MCCFPMAGVGGGQTRFEEAWQLPRAPQPAPSLPALGQFHREEEEYKVKTGGKVIRMPFPFILLQTPLHPLGAKDRINWRAF